VLSLGDQLLGPVLLPNRLSGAEYSWLLVLLEHVYLYQRQHVWFKDDGATLHPTRLSVNNGYEVEEQSAEFHDPLNLILWNFDYENA
jgi:hypothetical protein